MGALPESAHIDTVQTPANSNETTLRQGDKRFNRSAFLTGSATSEVDRKTGERTAPKDLENIIIKAETREQYNVFLRTHLRGLYQGLAVDKDILNNPQHRHQKEIMDLLMDENGEINQEEFNKFMNTDKGIIITHQLMEEDMAVKSFAIGLKASADLEGIRLKIAEKLTIRTGEGQGKLNLWWNDYVKPLVEKYGLQVLTSATVIQAFATMGMLESLSPSNKVGTVAMGLIGGLLGAGVVGAGKGTLLAYESLRKEGIKFGLEQSPEVFNVIKDNQQEAAYMKAVYGLDVNDFAINTQTGAVELDTERTHYESIIPTEDLARDVIAHTKLRRDFLTKSLGINPDRVAQSPESYLINGRSDEPLQMELLGLQWQKRIIDKLQPNEAGNITGEIDNDLTRFMDARREVIMDYLKEYLEKQIAKPDQRPITKLENKKNDFTSGEAKNRRTTELQKRKDDISTKQNETEEELKRFTVHDQKEQELKDTRQKLRKEHNLLIPDNPQLSEVLGSIDAEIARLTSDLYSADPVNKPGIADRLNKDIADMNDAIADKTNDYIEKATAGKNFKGGIPVEILTSAQQRAERWVQAVYERNIRILQEQVNEKNQRITELRALRDQYRTQTAERMQEERKVLVEAPRELNEMDFAYQVLTARTITEHDLQTRSISELYDMVTAPGNLYDFLSVTEEERAELRKFVIQAKTEQLAKSIEEEEKSPKPNLDAYDLVTFGPITVDDLSKKSDQELIRILDTHTAYSALPADKRDILASARVESNRRLLIRYKQKLSVMSEDYKDQMKQVDENIDKLGNVEEQVSILDLTLTLLQREDEIMSGSRSLIYGPDREKYFETIPVPADRHFSEKERALYESGGYYEIMDLLFDYQLRVDRNEYFDRISKFITPDKLANLLNEAFGLSIINLKIEDVLPLIKDGVEEFAGAKDIRRGFSSILDKLYDEAMAI